MTKESGSQRSLKRLLRRAAGLTLLTIGGLAAQPMCAANWFVDTTDPVCCFNLVIADNTTGRFPGRHVGQYRLIFRPATAPGLTPLQVTTLAAAGSILPPRVFIHGHVHGMVDTNWVTYDESGTPHDLTSPDVWASDIPELADADYLVSLLYYDEEPRFENETTPVVVPEILASGVRARGASQGTSSVQKVRRPSDGGRVFLVNPTVIIDSLPVGSKAGWPQDPEAEVEHPEVYPDIGGPYHLAAQLLDAPILVGSGAAGLRTAGWLATNARYIDHGRIVTATRAFGDLYMRLCGGPLSTC